MNPASVFSATTADHRSLLASSCAGLSFSCSRTWQKRLAEPKSMWSRTTRFTAARRRQRKDGMAQSRELPNPSPSGCRFQFSRLCLFIFLLVIQGWSQENFTDVRATSGEQLNVHWVYGAYVPREAQLESLTGHQRARLFVRQTLTTPGIYIKSAFLSLIDQASGKPYEWGGGFEGYGRRIASNYGRSSIQNVFSTTGNAALQYEPRYDRCHCLGLGPRTKHALLRNFLTYNQTENELRPQFALYGAALGAGMLSSVWRPESKLWTEGYHGVVTQAEFGMLSNWIGEFAPEIARKLKFARVSAR